MLAEAPFLSGFFYIDRYCKNVKKIADPHFFRDQNWRHKLGWGQFFWQLIGINGFVSIKIYIGLYPNISSCFICDWVLFLLLVNPATY